jgi:hypothetical protein
MEHEHVKTRAHRGRVADLLESFDAPGEPPVEATADDLVSLIMDARFRIRAVFIRGIALPPGDTARLEQAVATAVDRAVQEVVRRNSARLIERLFRRQERAASRSVPPSPPHDLPDEHGGPARDDNSLREG